MLIMRNNFFFGLGNMLHDYSDKKLKRNSFVYTAIKSFYLTNKNHKILTLYTPQNQIKTYMLNMYYMNVLTNIRTNRWFIYKLIN
jgi:hypothetical protein